MCVCAYHCKVSIKQSAANHTIQYQQKQSTWHTHQWAGSQKQPQSTDTAAHSSPYKTPDREGTVASKRSALWKVLALYSYGWVITNQSCTAVQLVEAVGKLTQENKGNSFASCTLVSWSPDKILLPFVSWVVEQYLYSSHSSLLLFIILPNNQQ